MKAIDVRDKKFNIIINGISKRERVEIFDVPQNYNHFLKCLREGLEFEYSSITLIDFDSHLDGEKKVLLSLDPKLIQFIIEGAPRFSILSARVRPIQTNASIKRELSEQQETLLRLRREKEEQDIALRNELRLIAGPPIVFHLY